MSVPVLTIFNNKGGMGKTTVISHLAWTLSRLGKRVVAIDLDPQANLTLSFLGEDELEHIWESKLQGSTIFQCLKPLMMVGDIVEPQLKKISSNLYLIPGDVNLATYEDILSNEWSVSLGDGNLYRPMRVLSAFGQIMQMAARKVGADIILVDIGPSLGAINRSVLVSTDYIVIPLSADLFSLQGLRNIGPILQGWKSNWKKRLDNYRDNSEFSMEDVGEIPHGKMQPVGYLVQQYGIRADRPIKVYDQWVTRIPNTYREAILGEEPSFQGLLYTDKYCLGIIKHYRSLIPMAQEKHKPIFNLTSADGAIGSHAGAVQDAKKDFEDLAKKIADKIGLDLN